MVLVVVDYTRDKQVYTYKYLDLEYKLDLIEILGLDEYDLVDEIEEDYFTNDIFGSLIEKDYLIKSKSYPFILEIELRLSFLVDLEKKISLDVIDAYPVYSLDREAIDTSVCTPGVWSILEIPDTLVFDFSEEMKKGVNRFIVDTRRDHNRIFYASCIKEDELKRIIKRLNTAGDNLQEEINQGHGVDFFHNKVCIFGTGYTNRDIFNEYIAYL